MTPDGALRPGMRIGVYEITEMVGAGGMGQVYRARDTRLLRDIAVKVLPPSYVADPERKAWFQHEAQILAALNHPNIAVIHGLEEVDGVAALIMEYVGGPTLADRLQRGPMDVTEAVRLAGQIAAAFEYAHEKGIIHRDLKPANLKLTADGNIKVLDFGLAKAFGERAPTNDPNTSPTLTMAATRAGAIIGTPAYMAPEQAKGDMVNRRADIWAFGAVLYEMLTARQAFGRAGLTETIAAVIRDEPDWSALPRALPDSIDRLVRRCLIKDQTRRLQAMGEARIVTEEWLANPNEPPKTQTKSSPLGWVVAAVLSLILGAVVTSMLLRPAPEAPLRRYQLKPALGEKSAPRDASISPDGSMVAYVDGGRMWIQDLDKLDPREMPRTEGAQFTIWSPDSAWVAYVAKGKLWKIPARGGDPVPVASLAGVSMAYSTTSGSGGWGEDGRIVLATGSSALLAVPAQGGELTTLLAPDRMNEMDFHSASVLPEGRGSLFVIHTVADTKLAVFAGGARKILALPVSRLNAPTYSGTGHILFVRRDDAEGIWAVPFSLSSIELSGEPFQIERGATQPSLSRNGTLAFRWGSPGSRQLAFVDRAGNVSNAGDGLPDGTFPAISRDGRRILYVPSATAGSTASQIWTYDIAKHTQTLVASGTYPEWLPDSERIVYSVRDATGASVYLKTADSSREAQKIADGIMSSVSTDARYLFFSKNRTLWYQRLDANDAPVSLGVHALNARVPAALSPDNRYLLYVSSEFGPNEIILARFPAMDRKWRISVGTSPKWNRRGDRFYFVRDRTLCGVDFEAAGRIGSPRDVFSGDALDALPAEFGYDITPDEKSFLLAREIEERGGKTGIVVVQNWFREFQQRQRKTGSLFRH